VSDHEALGAAAARARYQTFHGAAPDRTVDVPHSGPVGDELGRVEAIEYSIDSPSTKSGTYRHEFGDTGFGNTGARPLLVETGEAGVLHILTPPDEAPFSVEDRGIVG
jgi:hypothetical protein